MRQTLSTFLCFLCFLLAACADNLQVNNNPEPPQSDGTEAQTPEPPAMAYASGWDEIVIVANYAKTIVDSVGHFSTSRTACYKEEWGVLELDDWNRLAGHANALAENGASLISNAISDDYCTPAPYDGRYMDGSTEIKLTGGKRILYETRGSKVCTSIREERISKDLLALINKIIEIAYRKGCQGWNF